MNQSLLIGYLLSFVHMMQRFYANSGFKKLMDLLARLLQRITRNSFFVNYFSSPSTLQKRVVDSVICRFFVHLASAVRHGAARAAQTVEKSLLVSWIGYFYQHIFTMSVRNYGIFVLSLTVVYAGICLVSGALTGLMAAAAVVLVVLSLLCILINRSLHALFTNSVLFRLCAKFLDVQSFAQKPQVQPTKKGYLFCAAAGILSGAAAALSSPLLVALTLAGLFAVGLVLCYYQAGVYLTVIALPFFPTMALVGLVLLSFLSFLLRFAFDSSMKFIKTPLDFPIILFASVLVISALTSFAVKSSVMAVLVYIAFILGYFLLTNTVKTKKQLYGLLSMVLLAGLFVAAYGIYQHIFGFAEGSTWIDQDMFSDIQTRVASTFENPNVLGEYLLLLIPVGLAFIWAAPKNYNKIIHLVITGLLALCMIYTYSRGCWIGLLVAFFLFFVFYDRRFIWIGVIALLLSPMFLPQTVIDRFTSVGDTTDTSTSYRVYIWMGTMQMFKDYWLCGIGIGTDAFNMVYPFYSYSSIVAPHSHNLYLQILVENGVLGIAAFLGILVVFYKTVIASILRTKDRLLNGLVIGLAAGLFGYLVQGMFDNVWYNYRVFLLFFVILGLAVCCVNVSRNGWVPKDREGSV